jgi:hypothetical protein
MAADERVVRLAGAFVAMTCDALDRIDWRAGSRSARPLRQPATVRLDADVPRRKIGGRDRLAEPRRFLRGGVHAQKCNSHHERACAHVTRRHC